MSSETSLWKIRMPSRAVRRGVSALTTTVRQQISIADREMKKLSVTLRELNTIEGPSRAYVAVGRM
jgi:hypothetical protein